MLAGKSVICNLPDPHARLFVVREILFRLDISTDTLPNIVPFTMAVFLTVVFSELSVRFIETPLRRKGVNYANKIFSVKSI